MTVCDIARRGPVRVVVGVLWLATCGANARAQSPLETVEVEVPKSAGPRLTVPDAAAETQLYKHVCELHVTESLVNKALKYSRTEQGPVREMILGARVVGRQTTDTQLRIDFRPCDSYGAVQLQLSGRSQTETVGHTPQASVQSLGNHDFLVTKPVMIDGLRVKTWQTQGRVMPSTTHLGARTPLSRWPLLGPLAGRIALQEARRRKPAAEFEAGRKLLDKLLPKINRQVDDQLAKVNSWRRRKLPATLARVQLDDAQFRVSSSDESLRFRLDVPQLHAPDWAPPLAKKPAEMQIEFAVHESLINHFLSQLDLGGVQIADAQLSQMWTGTETRLNELMSGRELTPFEPIDDSVRPELAMVQLDATRPIQCRFQDGEAELTLYALFHSTLGAKLGLQEIVIAFEAAPVDGQIALKPGRVRVAPVDENNALGLLARSIIRHQITQRVRRIQFPDTYAPRGSNLQHIRFKVAEIDAQQGWLSVVAQAEDATNEAVKNQDAAEPDRTDQEAQPTGLRGPGN